MADISTSLASLSDEIARVTEQASASVVSVIAGNRASSGIHWRPGVIVTAEEVLEQDEGITLTLPGGRKVEATLAGRDPTTDVAVLRFQADGLPVAQIAASATLRAGALVLAVGGHDGAPVASFGIVAHVGGAWQSMRGGAIDALIRLDLALNPAAEGGALTDVQGRTLGMVVSGPRRRVLAIPAATIDRAVDRLLAKGYVGRGYLGAGLQSAEGGVLVASLDREGPAAKAGLVVGDIVTAWNTKPVGRVREVMRLLGPDSVGTTAALALLRGGAPANLDVVVGERRVR